MTSLLSHGSHSGSVTIHLVPWPAQLVHTSRISENNPILPPGKFPHLISLVPPVSCVFCVTGIPCKSQCFILYVRQGLVWEQRQSTRESYGEFLICKMGTTKNRLSPTYRPGEFLLRQLGVVGNDRVSKPDFWARFRSLDLPIITRTMVMMFSWACYLNSLNPSLLFWETNM